MRECSVKRGEIISRQTKSTKLSGFHLNYVMLLGNLVETRQMTARVPQNASFVFFFCFFFSFHDKLKSKLKEIINQCVLHKNGTVAFSMLSMATKTYISFGITLMHHKNAQMQMS